jgi:hypothetical protein
MNIPKPINTTYLMIASVRNTAGRTTTPILDSHTHSSIIVEAISECKYSRDVVQLNTLQREHAPLTPKGLDFLLKLILMIPRAERLTLSTHRYTGWQFDCTDCGVLTKLRLTEPNAFHYVRRPRCRSGLRPWNALAWLIVGKWRVFGFTCAVSI